MFFALGIFLGSSHVEGGQCVCDQCTHSTFDCSDYQGCSTKVFNGMSGPSSCGGLEGCSGDGSSISSCSFTF